MPQENVFGIVPYAFEPEYTEEELENLTTDTNYVQLFQHQKNSVPVDNAFIVNIAVIQLGDLGCITDHDQFDLQILNADDLSLAFNQSMMFILL